MKTNPIYNQSDGTYCSFQIDNMYISIKSIVGILGGLEGVKNIKTRKLFANSIYRVTFEYNGINWAVWEPYDDSDAYWIEMHSPEEGDFEAAKIDVKKIQAAFDAHRFNIFIKCIKFLIDLVCFIPGRFVALFWRHVFGNKH